MNGCGIHATWIVDIPWTKNGNGVTGNGNGNGYWHMWHPHHVDRGYPGLSYQGPLVGMFQANHLPTTRSMSKTDIWVYFSTHPRKASKAPEAMSGGRPKVA